MGDTLIGNAVATAEVELQLGQIFAAGDALSKPGQADVGDAFACGQDEAELAQARREALRHFYQPSIGEGAAPRKRKTEGLSVGVLSQSLTIAAHRALCQNRAEPAVHSKGRPQLSIHAGVLGVTFQRLHVQFRQRPARHGVQDASSVYILTKPVCGDCDSLFITAPHSREWSCFAVQHQQHPITSTHGFEKRGLAWVHLDLCPEAMLVVGVCADPIGRLLGQCAQSLMRLHAGQEVNNGLSPPVAHEPLWELSFNVHGDSLDVAAAVWGTQRLDYPKRDLVEIDVREVDVRNAREVVVPALNHAVGTSLSHEADQLAELTRQQASAFHTLNEGREPAAGQDREVEVIRF
mmetsp:Transcript_134840/g.430640  ORF Transcript_134840/g.430640 Transcript_134840/m.430640 type:complete len:350 (-) Transcript_134840:220-1269(-)